MHRGYVADTTRDWVDRKYAAGQEEHGGDLSRKAVLEHLAEEATDMMVYVIVLSDQMREATFRLKKLLDVAQREGGSWLNRPERLWAEEAYNILQYGNPEGETEEELNDSEVKLIK
jgi:hypothetical protein